jgi:ankyrin repeat protein
MIIRWTAALLVVALTCSLAAAGEIHEAAKEGDLEAVMSLLQADPALIDTPDDGGRTPLHHACREGQGEVARFLLEQGADANVQNRHLVTPLHYAAARGDEPVTRMLLEIGAALDVKDLDSHAPLHYAAIGGFEEVTALLIEKGADLELKDDHGRTALVLAAREMGGPGVVRVLLEAGADIDSRDEADDTALSLAAWRGTNDVVDLLIEMGASIPTEGLEAKQLLVYAASKRLKGLFTTMVEKGAPLEFDTENGGDLLHSAAAGGDPEIIQMLVDRGFDPDKADINGWRPLHFAADMGRIEAARLLVEAGADIEARTLMGQSALNIAKEWEYAQLAEALTAMGADRSPPRFPELRGDYLGQRPPGDSPQVFARGIVTGRFGLHSSIVFSPDGAEAFWSQMIPPRESGYGSGRVMRTRLVDGKWTYPEPAVFDGIEVGDCPFFSPDGKRLYDISGRPLPGETGRARERIWVWTRSGDGWADPEPLDPVINDLPLHWQFSVDGSGNVYFNTRREDGFGEGDIYCSELVDGDYQVPYNLGGSVNADGNEGSPFIAPDGSYLVFCKGDDLHVSVRRQDGSWTEAVNLGDTINTPSYELCPIVTPDGKYLFYLSEYALKWVDAGAIRDVISNVSGK